LKVSTNVKIAVECFENFGEANAPNAPPACAPAWHYCEVASVVHALVMNSGYG